MEKNDVQREELSSEAGDELKMSRNKFILCLVLAIPALAVLAAACGGGGGGDRKAHQ